MKGLAVLLVPILLALPSSADARRHRSRPPIAFWLDGVFRGATRTQAIRRCQRATHERCGSGVIAIRGPYVRGRRVADPDDDPKEFVYRGSDGYWYNWKGDSVGCDASGCP